MRDCDVIDVELELTGCCNLKCPLCAGVLFKDKCGPVNIRPVKEWIDQLKRYTNLKSVCMSGICSEPTLYPEFIQLIDYLVSRKISLEIYTNGCTNNAKWWNELNKHLSNRDMVIFTICGSTQELHEKYRVGSNLQTMLDNAKCFIDGNVNDNDCIQHIKFEYNKADFDNNMKPIIDIFHNKILIDSSPLAERWGVIKDDIHMVKEKSLKYNVLVQSILKRRKNKVGNICCRSKNDNFLLIDQFGNEYPCGLYRLFSSDSFNKEDYRKIDSFQYEFCYDCEQYFIKLANQFRIEGIV